MAAQTTDHFCPCGLRDVFLHAMARGVVINELSSKLAGDLDLQGLLGLDHGVPPGCEHRPAERKGFELPVCVASGPKV